MTVWCDGELLTGDAAAAWTDRGRLLGHGVFTTVLVRDGQPLHQEAHVARLRGSVAALGLGELALDGLEVMAELLWSASEPRPRRAALRVTVSAGEGRGLDGGGALRTTASLSPLPDRAPGQPAPAVRAAVVATHRVDPAAAHAGHKTLSWLPWILARRAARAAGADVALVPTVDGDLACADAANLFVVREGVLRTPPLDRGVLPGITRARVLALAGTPGAPAMREERIAVEELADATEIILTSSLGPVTPVEDVGGREQPSDETVARWLASCLDAV